MLINSKSMSQSHRRDVQPSLFLKFIDSAYACGRFIWGILMIGIASDTNQKNPWVELMQEIKKHFKPSQEYQVVRWGLCSAEMDFFSLSQNVSKRDEFTLNTDMSNRF